MCVNVCMYIMMCVRVCASTRACVCVWGVCVRVCVCGEETHSGLKRPEIFFGFLCVLESLKRHFKRLSHGSNNLFRLIGHV